VPRRETEWAKVEADFLFEDERFNGLGAAIQMAYIRLWVYCVKVRRDWFTGAKAMAWQLSKYLKTNYRVTARMLHDCCRATAAQLPRNCHLTDDILTIDCTNALLEMPDEHTLVVPGVRDKHKALDGWCVPFGAEMGRRQEGEREVPPPAPLDSAPPPAPKIAETDRVPYQQIVADWNVVAASCGLSAVSKITDGRRKAIRTRWIDKDWRSDYVKALALLPSRSFALGDNDRGWRIDFDFFLKPGKVTKILEGAYQGGGKGKPTLFDEAPVEHTAEEVADIRKEWAISNAAALARAEELRRKGETL